MPSELDVLIEESFHMRKEVQRLQDQYNAKRGRILALMSAANQRVYWYGPCKVIRTEGVIMENVSKEQFIQALKEVDIPREKKVFIWNRSVKQVHRPEMVMLRAVGAGDGQDEGDV
jgi:hypothetical protein